MKAQQCLLSMLVFVLSWSGVVEFGFAGDTKTPVIPKGKGDHCVAETDYMRRNHMDLLVHQRDETVIRGIRDEPFSLVECVDCHVQRDAENTPIRVDAKEQFCESCHAFVAVKIDCFGCHAAVPDVASVENAGRAHEYESAENNSARNIQWIPHKQLLSFKQENMVSQKKTYYRNHNVHSLIKTN